MLPVDGTHPRNPDRTDGRCSGVDGTRPAGNDPGCGSGCRGYLQHGAVRRSRRQAGDGRRRARSKRTVRVIKPGDQVTMDFQAARLNIEVDAAGNISGVRCG